LSGYVSASGGGMRDEAMSRAAEILMRRYDIDNDTASSILTRLAMYDNRSVVDVARQLARPCPSTPTGGDRSSRNQIHVRIAAHVRRIHERNDADPAAALVELSAAAVECVPGTQYAGITVTDRRGRIDTQAATGRYPRLLDAIQDRHRQGPCVDAVWEHQIVRVDDLRSESRWPDYVRDALAESPIRSILSIEMFVEPRAVGALNLYADQPYAFDEQSEDLGFVYATHAALAWNALRRNVQFRAALASRDVIGQAKGILMERHQMDADGAFELLRRISQQSNTPVAEVSRRLIEDDPQTHIA
jgi:hypothetical protein